MAVLDTVFTGAMALITVGTNPTPIGKMKDIRCTENMSRARVGGLGTILPLEVPIMQWSGSFTCSYYLIDWDTARMNSSIRRDVSTNTQFEDYLVLQEQGITVNVFRKISDGLDGQGLPIPDRKPFAIMRRCFTDSESFNLAEGQVGGHDQSFQYLDPILKPV